MLNGASVQIRKLSDQGLIFRYSFYFVNVYSLSVIFLFFIMSGFFADAIDKNLFTEKYISVLRSRAYVSLWLIAAFNIAFFFRFYFVFFAALMIMYLINATIDQTLIFYSYKDFSNSPLLLAFYISRPFLILTLIVAVFKYDDQR